MGAKALIVMSLVAAALIGGCAGPQSRKSRPELGVTDEMLQRERSLHGGAGREIALLFNTGDIKEARDDMMGQGHGLRGTEFYMIQVAPNPAQPTQLVKVGFARKVAEDRSNFFYYEFYDDVWNSMGKLMPGGELYKYGAATETLLGRFDLNGAVARLYPAASGYGYDPVAQDQARVRMSNPDVAGLDSRGRAVHHTPHGSQPPVVVFTQYRGGEARLLGDNWDRTRFDEAEAIKLERLREKRHGGIGQDETYGGIQYKNGEPVDSNGKPLRPGSLGGK